MTWTSKKTGNNRQKTSNVIGEGMRMERTLQTTRIFPIDVPLDWFYKNTRSRK